MSIVIIETEAFSRIMEKLDSIEAQLKTYKSEPESLWWDSEEVCAYLKISQRTLQNSRDYGVLNFSQYGAKIWYKYQDIQRFLENNSVNN